MRHTRTTLAVLTLALLATTGSALAQATPAPSFEAALKAAQDSNQLVIVDFYADW